MQIVHSRTHSKRYKKTRIPNNYLYMIKTEIQLNSHFDFQLNIKILNMYFNLVRVGNKPLNKIDVSSHFLHIQTSIVISQGTV